MRYYVLDVCSVDKFNVRRLLVRLTRRLSRSASRGLEVAETAPNQSNNISLESNTAVASFSFKIKSYRRYQKSLVSIERFLQNTLRVGAVTKHHNVSLRKHSNRIVLLSTTAKVKHEDSR
jgi:hypothetical protein